MWSKGQVKNLSKEVIESGLVENAKPIYFHPVILFKNSGDDGVSASISCIILGQLSTGISSYANFKTYCKDNEITNIPASGFINDTAQSTSIAISHIYRTGDTFSVYGIKQDGTYGGYNITSIALSIADPSNKIN